MPDDIPILAGARLALVGIADQIARAVRLLRHEGPLQPGREPGTTAPPQAGVLDLLDDSLPAPFQDGLRAVPVSARTRTFQERIVKAIEIGEYPVLILQHRSIPRRKMQRRQSLRPALGRRSLPPDHRARLRPFTSLQSGKKLFCPLADQVLVEVIVDLQDGG